MRSSGKSGRGRTIDIEHAVTVVLRAGVVASIVTIAAGMVVAAVRHPKLLMSSRELARLLEPGAAYPRSMSELVRGVVLLRGQAIMTVGLLILLSLPVLRVILTAIIFFFAEDRLFVLISLGVLALLLLSLLIGAS